MAGISGLGSGLDVGSLVNQLMQLERAPANRYNTLRLAALSRQTAWSDLTAKLGAVRTLAEGLNTARKAAASAATSSDDKVVTATAANGAALGTTPLKVLQLATSEQRTSAGLSGPAARVGAGSATVTAGLAGTGATGLTVSGDLAPGRHTVTVRPPTPAVLTGAQAPALSLTSTDLSVTGSDGAVHQVQLDPSYASVDALATAVRKQLSGVADVAVVDGRLSLTSRDTGPAATLTVGGGAAAELGLGTTPAAGRGHTASLDGGGVVDLTTSGTVQLTGPTGAPGTLTLTTGPGPLAAGTITTNVIRTTAASTLGDLTSALNAAGSPASAALVDTGDGSASPYRLVVTASASGSKGALVVDAAQLPYLAGATSSVVAAKDAQLEVGGAVVTRSSNTVADLLPDVTLNLLRTGDSTVSVSRDQPGLTTKVKGLVEGLNALLTSVSTQTRAGTEGTKGGPLAGSGLARSVAQQVQGLAYQAVGSTTTRSMTQIGLSVSRTGQLTLDEVALGKAVAADPEGVSAVLSSYAGLLEAKAKELSGPDGSISTAGKTAGTEAQSRQKQIDALDLRLEITERRYRTQYARLDSMMGMLNSQSGRLASQIAGLGQG